VNLANFTGGQLHEGVVAFAVVQHHELACTASDLAARVFALECELYPRAIAHYLTQHPDLIRLSGGGDWG